MTTIQPMHRANLLTGEAGHLLALMVPDFVAGSGTRSTYVSTPRSFLASVSSGTHVHWLGGKESL